MSSSEGKTCNRCNKKGLSWDKEFYKKTGKWKLENHKRADGKWCNKPPEIMMIKTRNECQLCPYCEGSSFGLIRSADPEDLKRHIQTNHKDGLIKTDLDYKMQGGMPRFYVKFWSNDFHYQRYKHG